MLLERLYKKEKLSVREIARLTKTSHFTRLEEFQNDSNDLFKTYSELIKQTIIKINNNNSAHAVKAKLKSIITSLMLHPTHIKIALSSVNLKGLVSMVFAVAPPDRLELPT